MIGANALRKTAFADLLLKHEISVRRVKQEKAENFGAYLQRGVPCLVHLSEASAESIEALVDDLKRRFNPEFVILHEENQRQRLARFRKMGVQFFVAVNRKDVPRLAEKTVDAISAANETGFLRRYKPYALMADRGLDIRGVLHVGAQKAQEAPFYRLLKGPTVYFEAIPRLAAAARDKLAGTGIEVIEACCSDRDGDEVTFNVSSADGAASSMYEPSDEWVAPALSFVETLTLETSRVDSLLTPNYPKDRFNLLVLDVQGAEVNVLKGMGDYLQNIDGIYCEVSDQPLYKGGCSTFDVISYLNEQGFGLHGLISANQYWGDAFFANRKLRKQRQAEASILKVDMISASSISANMALGALIDQGLNHYHPFFSTKREKQPWIEIDLGRQTDVSKIVWCNRVYFEDRNGGLIVKVSPDKEAFETIFDETRDVISPKPTYEIDWTGQTRFIRFETAAPVGSLVAQQIAVL